jgi:hypothetical protein
MPTGPLEPKPQHKRIEESIRILRKLTEELNISPTNPSVRLLKLRMARYWREGAYDADRIPLEGYDRIIVYRLPKWDHQEVEVILKHSPLRRAQQLPSDLLAEVEAGMSNGPQSET